MNEHEDEDCRYYYVTSPDRRVYELQRLVENALDIEPTLRRLTTIPHEPTISLVQPRNHAIISISV